MRQLRPRYLPTTPVRDAVLALFSLVWLTATIFAATTHGTNAAIPAQAAAAPACVSGSESPLALPSTVAPEKLADYEKQVLAFLKSGQYVALGWCGDKRIRDTGPWIDNVSYGTHRAVRVFYSPAVMRWLMGGRTGVIPDGAMIIKEQVGAPAARYDNGPAPTVADWTVMIKDAKGANDGWFWGEFWFDPTTGAPMPFDDHAYPFNYPAAGFGLYCLRCHAVAEKELTFASLSNVAGFAGDPLTFRVDDSWRVAPPFVAAHNHAPAPTEVAPLAPVVAPDPTFLQTFRAIGPIAAQQVVRLPNETWDLVVPPAGGKAPFLTSNQCQGCHSAALMPFGPTMYLGAKTGNGVNVSPYTEWRWSPMGLAGRDPIFFAQLESELAYANEAGDAKTRATLKQTIVDTCFRCHGVMGKRQHDIDDPGGHFSLADIQQTGSAPGARYGALARDGVSCLACHRIAPDTVPPDWKKSPLEYLLEHSITGLFETGSPDQVFGPFKDDEIVTVPMNNALGAKPVHNEYIKSSRVCASCHTIKLPVLDHAPVGLVGPTTPHSIEQATYLEWLNSAYQNEFGPANPKAKTCQACHLPGGYTSASRGIDVPQIQTRMAIVEDETYPATDHRAPADQIRVRVREAGFGRHELLGLNGFLLEFFRQFNDILGVRKSDYMTGTSDNLEDAQANLFEQARTRTATIAASAAVTGRELTANVTVTNLTGHRFPSGVGFRRAWIELLVIEQRDERQRLVWSSGRTNTVGVIVDAEGRPLPTEFFAPVTGAAGRQQYQAHHDVITSDDQVQIYEELVQDAAGRFTTSFLRRDHELKDNRLLPLGWSASGPDPSLNGEFLEATFPKGDAARDPDYRNGSGSDAVTYRIQLPADVDPRNVSVQARLFYQSIPPYFLNDRFTAAKGDATQRLYYLTSNVNLSATPMSGWKIAIAATSAAASTSTSAPAPAGGARRGPR
jgi:mono/diheme cytochrome c family protein